MPVDGGDWTSAWLTVNVWLCPLALVEVNVPLGVGTGGVVGLDEQRDRPRDARIPATLQAPNERKSLRVMEVSFYVHDMHESCQSREDDSRRSIRGGQAGTRQAALPDSYELVRIPGKEEGSGAGAPISLTLSR